MIGLLIAGILVFYIADSIIERNWEMLRQTLFFTAALISAIGLLSGTAWLVVKILTRGRKQGTDEK